VKTVSCCEQDLEPLTAPPAPSHGISSDSCGLCESDSLTCCPRLRFARLQFETNLFLAAESRAKESAQKRPVVEHPVVTDAAERRLLFISHANPQDNAAAAWFATQLNLMGYDVWCDIKNTHAGESSFWLKVQKKIENEAAKFLFILSDNSRDFEKKPGVYKEVQTADNCKRDNFILPLRMLPWPVVNDSRPGGKQGWG
jgi:TIR domain